MCDYEIAYVHPMSALYCLLTCRCFLNAETNFIWAFIAPVMVIIVVNFVLFLIVARVMWKHQKRRTDNSKVANVRYVKLLWGHNIFWWPKSILLLYVASYISLHACSNYSDANRNELVMLNSQLDHHNMEMNILGVWLCTTSLTKCQGYTCPPV